MGLDSTKHAPQELSEPDSREQNHIRWLDDAREQNPAQRVAVTAEIVNGLDAGLKSIADILAKPQSSDRHSGQDLDSHRQTSDKDIWSTIYGVFDKFPKSGTVKHQDFEKVFGEKSAQLLDKIGVQSIQVVDRPDGSQHYKINFAQNETRTLKDADITTSQGVEFDVTRNGSTIKLDNIDGLKIKHTGGHFSATVDNITFTHAPNGSVRCVGNGHWGIFHGSKGMTIAPDGTVTADK